MIFDYTSVHELAYLVPEGGCWITIDMADNIDDVLAECDWPCDEYLDRLHDNLTNYCASSFDDVWASASSDAREKVAIYRTRVNQCSMTRINQALFFSKKNVIIS